MVRRFITIILFTILLMAPGCNMFMVAVRNVGTFFSEPDKVPNKIKDPVKPNARLSALWIGHATVLIQMDDKIILTDPFLTETMGELGRRVIEPGINIKDIPKCDLILISHSHLDHLSFGSLEMIEGKNHGTPLVFPEGLEDYMPNYDFKLVKMKNDNGYEKKVIGETKIINGIKVTTVFAQHWGGRYGLDGYMWGNTAYTGYILEYNGMTVYFAGDTGYDSAKFKMLGESYKVDLALIPIGPCAECNQCGTANHVFPVDAVYIFNDLNPKWMLPIHYATLMFAQAEPIEPEQVLMKIVNNDSLSDRIKPLKIGGQRIYIDK